MGTRGDRWVWAVVGAVVLLVVGVPAALVVAEMARGAARAGVHGADVRVDLGLLGFTALMAGMVAVGAVVLAWPAAWASRRMGARGLLLLATPLLLPSYLAYSGWGLARAPGTWLDKWLQTLPQGAGGENTWPILAGKVFAVGGMMLWVWPLAALVLGIGVRRLDAGVLESLRLDAGGLRRWGQVARMLRGSVAAAFGLVFLVMLGSAVVFNVGNVNTFGVSIWLRLDAVGAGEHWKVWVSAWPLVAIALGAAVWLARRLGRVESAEPWAGHAGWSRAGAAAVWVASVAAPVALFAWSLHSWRSVRVFWRVNAGAMRASAGVALGVGLAAVVIGAGVWYLWTVARWRGAVRWGVVLPLLVCGLVPGVLVGSGVAHAWNLIDSWMDARFVTDTSLIVVLGHVARFGFLAALVGVWLGAQESDQEREQRRMDAGDGVRGWWGVLARWRVGVLAVLGVVAGLLSLHEVESSVMLMPASSAGGGIGWRMLQNLHFLRMEDLSAGVLWLAGMGLAVWLLVVAAVGLARARAGV
jgi:ABC-type Fe3+ transport system permease subunit